MNKNKISFFKNKEDLYINFDNNDCKFILITGATGSGKSTLALNLTSIYNCYKISLDLIFGYELYEPTKVEKEIMIKFKKKYPKWDLKLFRKETKDNYNVFSKWVNLFYDFIFNEFKNTDKIIIIEGEYFLDYIDIDKIKNMKFIIKRTSFIVSIMRRMNRNLSYLKKDYKNNEISLYRYIRRIIAAWIFTISKSFRWYSEVNEFIEKIL